MNDAARRALADDLRDVWAPRAGTGPITVLDVGDGSDGLLLAADGHQVVLVGGPAGLRQRVDEARLGHRCTVVDALGPTDTHLDLVVAHDTPLTADVVADLAPRARPGGFVSLAGRVEPTVEDAERWAAEAGLRIVVRRDGAPWHLLTRRPPR